MSVSHWGIFPGWHDTKPYGVDGQCLIEDPTTWVAVDWHRYCEATELQELLRRYPQ